MYGIRKYPFELNSRWHQAKTEISSFEPEELLGTKLRALLQRRKNRDLFDLHEGLKQLSMDPNKLIACFEYYLGMDKTPISRAVAEQRMLEKLQRNLTEDITPLLPVGVRFNNDDALEAFGIIWTELIGRIKGEPWKLSEQVIDKFREGNIPNLLR